MVGEKRYDICKTLYGDSISGESTEMELGHHERETMGCGLGDRCAH